MYMYQNLPRTWFGPRLLHKMNLMLRIIEGRNVCSRLWFLSLLQDPEIGMIQDLARVIDLGIANFHCSCSHFDVIDPCCQNTGQV
jgi:hypothetical protein